MDSSLCQCSIVNPGDASAPPKTFSFDGVYFTEVEISVNLLMVPTNNKILFFGPLQSTTEALYNDVAYPLVEVSSFFCHDPDEMSLRSMY